MPGFFADNSPYLSNPLLTPERTTKEVDFVVETLGLRQGDSILDVGCAFGRHAVELATRGFNVTAIDPSVAMIDAARENARQANVAPKFEVADAVAYESDLQFDAAIALFTVLGQIENNGDNREMLPNIAHVLKPSGQLLVEVPQRGPYKAMLKPQDRFGDVETYTQITRSYLDDGRVLVEEFEIGSPAGIRELQLSFRLFDQDEVDQLLTEAGFTSVAWFANYEGAPLQSDSPFMLAHATRAE